MPGNDPLTGIGFGLGLFNAMLMAPLLLYGYGVAFLVIYILGAVRRARGGPADPQLGVKVLLLFLLSLAFQFSVFGIAACAMAILERSSEQELQSGIGFILGGALSAAYPGLAYWKRIESPATDRVLRQVLGLNAILAGLVYVVATTFAMVVLVAGGGEMARVLAVAVVYLGAHLACAWPLLRLSEEPPRGRDEVNAV